ncbi:MAG: AAA family ATPase [Alteromonadaceae bacterium]|nr:AAA family ATPase [Alteromonadaceae bacterium]
MTYSRNGGVSKKNTATVNLAYELSQLNKRVLILNFDGQEDTTKNSVTNKEKAKYC